MTNRPFALSLSSLLLSVCLAASPAVAVECSVQYDLPADIPVPTSQANNDTFQGFGWQSFLGLNAPGVGGQISTTGDNVPQWAAWSTTDDLLLCQGSPTPSGCVCPNGDCTKPGTHYYPSQCQAVSGYQNYRVLTQVNKVDDSFEEASTGGVSGDPVIDRFGGFLRYEIVLSPATYTDVIEQQLYDPTHVQSLTSSVNLGCGTASYSGGDPANPQMGSLVIKAAWMDVTAAVQSGQLDTSKYHLDQLLVFTPYYRNSSNVATCELRTMALVGAHIAHKTENQPNWIWSTFEHNLNAPDCTGPMPGPGTQQVNTSCPASVGANFNFYGENCNPASVACAACNAAPATNGTCANPDTSIGMGFCLNQPPNSTGGISKLCRQVPIASYPEAAAWNTACQAALGSSVWSNYSLISSQWGTSAFAAGCNNVASQISGTSFAGPVNDSVILPKVASGGTTKPLLANTSMESYDRSNCTGCHSKANVTNTGGTPISTDLMYWLQLQVFAPAATRRAFSQPVPTATSTARPTATATPMSSGGGDDGGCQVAPAHGRTGTWLVAVAVGMLLRRRRR